MKRSAERMSVAAHLIAAFLFTYSLGAQPVGQWDFDQGNLAGTVGAGLDYLDGAGAGTSQKTKFGTTTVLGIPDIGGVPAQVMAFPGTTGSEGYSMPVNSAGNGEGGGLVNQWTLILDLLYPAESDGKFRAIIETDGRLISEDADFFVNTGGGIGISGNYSGKILPNTWYRVGVVVDTTANVLRKYINGELVGTQSATSGGTAALDGRWALLPGGTAELFTDNDGETAAGYVNSIQLRNAALSTSQMRALGGPSATGIPQQIPPIPAFVESWIPNSAIANRNTDIGVVLNLGDSTIADASVTLKLDGALVPVPQISRAGKLMTVRKPNSALFDVGSKHAIEVTYTDSVGGLKTVSREFTAALFVEDFDGLVLGPNVDESNAGDAVWTKTPPSGWNIDDTQMFAADDPDVGVTEWEGWSFANRDWWVLADDQTRSQFTKANGTVAIADPDEWDDRGSPAGTGTFNSLLRTSAIPLAGIPANSLFVQFDSSWRPECCDDGPDNSNNQTATVTASFDGGAPVELLKWDSKGDSPTYKPDSQNETVLVQLNNPAGANSVVLTFGLTNAGNDWWWAFDNLIIQGGVAAPIITAQPLSQTVSAGTTVTLTVEAQGTAPFNFQWRKNGENIAGATSSSLVLTGIQKSAEGDYSVVVSNSAGSATSESAKIMVLDVAITTDLVTHLKFDNTFDDASGKGNNAFAVGAPTFAAGKIGTHSLHIPSGVDYASLGAPADLNFGTATDFSISFWTKVVEWNSDPAFISNKDWDSGGNQGYVLATAGDGRIQWNLAGPPGSRKDYDGPAGTFSDGNWHHIVVTFDRDGDATTFVDGVARNATSLTANQNNVDTPEGYSTNIGQDGPGDYGPQFTNADYDDIGIWRRLLTSQEVFAIFTAGQTGNDLTKASVSAPAVPPVITVQPQGATLIQGGNVTLGVTATGTPPLSYQWKRNGADISGATEATLVINNITPAQSGEYTVVVSNSAGSVTSAAATVAVEASLVAPTLVYSQWDFDQGDLSATVGAPLEFRGDTSAGTSFSTAEIAGQPAKVMKFPAATSSQGFVMTHGLPANGGGTNVNQYTLIMDVMFPSESDGKWRGLFQTTPDNSTDGDLFVNTGNGIGISGQYHGTIAPNTWHRIAFAVDLTTKTLAKYVDGTLVNLQTLSSSSGGVDQRWSLVDKALLFTDEDNETATGFVNSIQIRNRRLSDAEIAALGGATAAGISAPEVTGQWDFDAGDLSATIGVPLQYRGDTGTGTTFSTATIGGAEAKVMGFPKATPTQGYIMTHGAAANGGGTNVNLYTIIMDVMFPADSDGKWRGLLQTAADNSNDGDMFVNTGNGIGISGQYHGAITPNTWHRVAFAFDLTAKTVGKYIDGQLVNLQTLSSSSGGVDQRWSLFPTALLFTDEDNETAAGFVNSIQVRNRRLSDAEIAALGGATAAGIPLVIGGGGGGELRITAIGSGANSITLEWSGGTAPFVVQKKNSLSDSEWMTLLATPERRATVLREGSTGFLRVGAGVSAAVSAFTSVLTGQAERPAPVTTSATGAANLSLTGDTLTFSVSYQGLTGTATAAHIHGPATADQVAPPMINLAPFNGGTFGISGTLSGSVTLTADQKAALLDGTTYLNIHTGQNGGGEIRGQIIPGQAAP